MGSKNPTGNVERKQASAESRRKSLQKTTPSRNGSSHEPGVEAFIWQDALDAITGRFVIQDNAYRILQANAAVFGQYCLRRERVIGRRCFEVFAESDSPCADCPVTATLQTSRPATGYVEKGKRKDGYWLRTYPIVDSEGKVLRVVVEDITESIKTEQELNDSQERFRNIVSLADGAILVVSANGRIELVNHLACEISGYEHEKLLGMPFSDLFGEEGRRTVADLFDRIRVGDNPRVCCEVALITAGGQPRTAEVCISSSRDRKGGTKTYAYLRDISDRKRMEEEIRKANAFLRNLIQSSMDGIIAADMKGNIVIFNEGAERILGYRADEVIGKVHITRIYPPDEAKEVMRKLRSPDYGGEGKLAPIDATIVANDGTHVPVNLSAAIVYESGEEMASVGFFTDLREKVRMEKELRDTQVQLLQLEKMASLGKLAAGVAHQINNPLGGILLFANWLLRQTEYNDPRRENINRIVEDALRCREIVKSLLEFAHQTRQEMRLTDLNREIERTVFLLENQALFHNIEVVKEFDKNLPPVYADTQQLNQAFMNIILNAAEAMSGSGRLTVRSRSPDEDGWVALDFSDTGCGIPKENLSKIFDPFFTTKPPGKGTGLGLSMTYGIVERHGGRIKVASEVGKGTTFTIFLPTRQCGAVDEHGDRDKGENQRHAGEP